MTEQNEPIRQQTGKNDSAESESPKQPEARAPRTETPGEEGVSECIAPEEADGEVSSEEMSPTEGAAEESAVEPYAPEEPAAEQPDLSEERGTASPDVLREKVRLAPRPKGATREPMRRGSGRGAQKRSNNTAPAKKQPMSGRQKAVLLAGAVVIFLLLEWLLRSLSGANDRISMTIPPQWKSLHFENGLLYYIEDGSLHAIERNRKERFSVELASQHTQVIYGRQTVFLVDPEVQLVGLNAQSGEKSWSIEDGALLGAAYEEGAIAVFTAHGSTIYSELGEVLRAHPGERDGYAFSHTAQGCDAILAKGEKLTVLEEGDLQLDELLPLPDKAFQTKNQKSENTEGASETGTAGSTKSRLSLYQGPQLLYRITSGNELFREVRWIDETHLVIRTDDNLYFLDTVKLCVRVPLGEAKDVSFGAGRVGVIAERELKIYDAAGVEHTKLSLTFDANRVILHGADLLVIADNEFGLQEGKTLKMQNIARVRDVLVNAQGSVSLVFDDGVEEIYRAR